MIAYSRLPHRFEDGRHDVIENGFRALGYAVHHDHAPHHPTPGDVLITWNSYGNNESLGKVFRAAGARHVVCEEAYIREIHGERYFAMALWGHNGSGEWFPGGPERWASWGIEPAPWREETPTTAGKHVLVCGQRGFGYNAMAMPDDWPDQVLAELRQRTFRTICFRPHPRRRRRLPVSRYDKILNFTEPLAKHLCNAWATVVYTSNAATDSLLAGVPAFYRGPTIVTAGGASPNRNVNWPLCDDVARLGALRRLAWAQWSRSEIERGDAARHLLR